MSSTAGSSSRPTLLLLHGCFANTKAWDVLVPHLEKAGFPIVRGTFPSSNPEKPAEVTAQKDIDFIRKEYTSPLVEKEGKDIIIVAHSFSGIIGSAAAVGLSRTDRRNQSLGGGVVGFICVAANLAREGQTLVETAGGKWPPWLVRDKPREGLAIIEPLFETLVHDADRSLGPQVELSSVPHGYNCMMTTVSAPCWAEEGYAGRLAYVRTAEDRINPAFAQDLWVEGTGVKWDIANMDASHAPYLSKPEELSRHIVDFATKFGAVR